MLYQVPAPPAPPELPVIVSSGLPPWIPPIIAIALLVSGVILYPLVRALARRLEGRVEDPALRGEMDLLHARLGDVEQLEQRVMELENRLEFSERLLTQQRDAALQRPDRR